MNVGEVRIAEDKDFEILKIYLTRNDGWNMQYQSGRTKVWTRTPPQDEHNNFKMIKVTNYFLDMGRNKIYQRITTPIY